MPERENGSSPTPTAAVGIVGAGQLARMVCEAASVLSIRTAVLAGHHDDAAASVAHDVVVGTPADAIAMRTMAQCCDVLTFDHEQVDLGVLADLERAGTLLRPGLETLRMAVDKAQMRARLQAGGLPVPAYEVLDGPPGASTSHVAGALEAFASRYGWPVVVKATRGGYDGKGVWVVHDAGEAQRVVAGAAANATPLLVEELVKIDIELAVVVARRADGETVAWPPVETAQIDGVCREVVYPGRVPPALAREASALAREVAGVAGVTGVLAVELFSADGRLLVNEIAARPHNSAHWTIEGATTSQFENHLRAVLDLPLGDTSPIASHVASVNIFGAPSGGTGSTGSTGSTGGRGPGSGLAHALAVRGAHVHLYGKAPRPGRKLGHVTICGEDARDVRRRAWAAATALGTPVPASLDLGTP